jgi:hypothetical protein
MRELGSWGAGELGRKVLAISAAGLLALAALAAKPVTLDEAVKRVTATGAYETAERLSSPEFEGRMTGTPGFDAAALYVAGRLRSAGLPPPKEFPDHFQPFQVTLCGIESARMELLPEEGKSGGPKALEYFKEWMPLLQSASGDVTAEVVFAGFGITAPELGRDDYAGLDAKGKIVLVLRGQPKDGREWGNHVESARRAKNARDHGAAGFLLADQAVASPNGLPIPGMPMAEVSKEFADLLLEGKKLKCEELKRVLEQGGTAPLPTGRVLHLEVRAKEPRQAGTCNVIAVLAGSDPSLAGEHVLVGAHLDHVGSWPDLLPGADDNASGSATLLEVARAAALLSPRPRRTLAFVWFGGEEMGLLGSYHLARNPVPSLGRCTAVLNMDMVGVGNGAYVSGGKNFPELMKALEAARDRRQPGLKLIPGLSSGEPRADHGPFQKAGIPAVSLFGSGGTHHGYHTPEDTIFFITPKSMEAIGRVVLDAAVALADEKKT